VTLPAGWALSESLTNANASYTAGTGSSNAGDTYSFGATGNSERALGGLQSGNLNPTFGASFTNNTGRTINELVISYTGEQWRLGASGRGADRIDFQYSTTATGLATGTFTDFDGLDFSSKVTNGTVGALDGNAGANRAVLSGTITGLSIPNGATFWIRWTDFNVTNSDDGLAVDDFSLVAHVLPSTNPSGVGAANPSSIAIGATTLLTVAVTPGTNPASTGLAVTADLTAVDGAPDQHFYDDGTHGDATAGDNLFSFGATVGSGATGGAKTLPATITDAQGRSATANIALTILAPTPPSGTGSANPNSVQTGDSSVLTVNVTPGTNPSSTGLSVEADLSSIGGSSHQVFNGGGNTFTSQATVEVGTAPGLKTLPVTISDAQGRSGSASIGLTVEQPPPPADHVVISQIYGGGGNSGASYQNDYVELFNPTTADVDLTGWTLQYASATGTSWSNIQPIGGSLPAGAYFLISLASNGATGAPVPPANIAGDINMSATAGKVALVRNGVPLSGTCSLALADPDLVDLVGYGTSANCREGAANAPAAGNIRAVFRTGSGGVDTNQNGSDFFAAAPNPRRTAPIVELGPAVFNTDPGFDDVNAPRDASITVSFTEAVDVTGDWYDITCGGVSHDSATVAHTANAKTYVITPNESFNAREQCTVTIFKDHVHDQDVDDETPNTDTLPADYSWTFTVAAAVPYPPAVHLAMGNPSGATADALNAPDNYLMEKPEFALSYNRDRGAPNWVSWHLSDEWRGTLSRNDTFRPDPAVPPDWYRVQAFDYFGTGFDRGHMTPSADRNKEIPINQATFLMSNMVPQAPDNNQGPWADFENYLRNTLLPANELYIVAGGAGTGGTGSSGFATTIANGHVTVPAFTWKVALVLTKGDLDLSRVSASTRTIAVLMPNVQGIRNDDWSNYLTTVDAVETLTGYDFFSNVPEIVQNSIEAGRDGDNPPGIADQLATTNEDTTAPVTLQAVSPHLDSVTFTVLSAPSHGAVTGTGGALTYMPEADFNGTDTFTFAAQDAAHASHPDHATVTIHVLEVNDPPLAADDEKGTDEDTPLSFPASDLTANDAAGPANESGQTLRVNSVGTTADTHGTLALVNGQVTYTPVANFNGLASFSYEVCDDGISAGGPDPRCATAKVRVNVAAVNDAPVLSGVPAAVTTPELAAYTFTAQASDVDGQPLTFSLVGAPAGATIDAATGQFSWTPTEAQGGTGTPYSLKVRVTDGVIDTDADIVITVSEVNQAPTLAAISDATVHLGDTLTFVAAGSDADIPVQALGYSLSPGAPAGTAIDPGTGVFTWTPAGPQAGSTYTFDVRVSDGVGATARPVSVTVVDTTPPAMSSVSLSATELWPPNHKMVDVAVGYDVSDLGDPAPACALSVTSSEPVDGMGDGDTAPDWEIADAHHLRLRAERAGGGTGRVYTVVAACQDRAGNRSQRAAAVTVPKSQGTGR
jgi:DNA/RNA endonuclease G (NUC1)